MKDNVKIFRAMAITLNDEDFEAAFQLMCEERNTRRELRMVHNKKSLRVGSIVEWSGSRSGACTGEVVKVKTKKAIVRQTNGGNITMSWTNCVSKGASSVGNWQHSVNGLVSGQTYHWRVMCENDNGQTLSDAQAFITTSAAVTLMTEPRP